MWQQQEKKPTVSWRWSALTRSLTAFGHPLSAVHCKTSRIFCWAILWFYSHFFFLIFPLRMHNWCSVYQCCLHSCALLESFRATGLQVLESWLGSLPPKGEQESATQISDQHRHRAPCLLLPVPAQVHFALFQHCRPPHILPELWKF